LDIKNSNLNKDVGILICGHGSRNKLAVNEFKILARCIQERFSSSKVEYGFLEFAKPSLTDGLEKLKQSSVKRVIAIPAMLFAAGHVKNDIPTVLMNFARNNDMEISYGRELGINNLMISAACERVKEVFKNNENLRPSESVLVVVGRGSSDPDANANVAKITRMIVEGLGMGWGETVFSGVTFPLVEPGLNHIVKLGYRNVILFPYFLFTGVLVSRIKRQRDSVAMNNPDITFFDAKYLSSHPQVIDTFVERIDEVFRDEHNNYSTNCSLCKYRSNLFGFEKEVGLLQESHHDNVEGLGVSCDLCEAECSGACEIEILTNSTNRVVHNNEIHENFAHSHEDNHHEDHHHEAYPNSQHPLGPLTLQAANKVES